MQGSTATVAPALRGESLLAADLRHSATGGPAPVTQPAPPRPAAPGNEPIRLAEATSTPARSVDTPHNDADARSPAPVTLVALPSGQAPMIAAGATAPAFRLFAEAIHAARRDERAEDSLAPPPVAATDPVRAALPVAPSDGASLDMADHRWPHAMVDRIEALRDAASAAADAASTSIRLLPEKLGAIDVSVRREGDVVHVHFAAEQAATRTLLNDAQPRLTELAEARGLKLGQASVGAGTDGNAQRQPVPQPARLSTAPAKAARDDEPEPATTRVA
ncbi:flagellar hook-length control protein FliK [Sphingomonas sp.]|uniref:flagellar hook-length control protein FliK n=1 Tax=Sphingomonas sp. TaxID=28214 RepID=UPI0035BBFEE6